VANAKAVLVADGDQLGVAELSPGDVEPVESIYAYPMGRLTRHVRTAPLTAAEASVARKWLRVAVAAEAAGLIQAAIDATVEHLTVRKQFGRPLGTFQALRHRMAECAVLAGGVKWLALKAAATGGEGDAALAAFHAQESGARIAYDLHQFLGAMGMTLEHPLHLWTYRLKLLLSELGGQAAQAGAVVQHCFGVNA
jgi:alkylation response protein AidB-like acyl-CoA dehydrogenase